MDGSWVDAGSLGGGRDALLVFGDRIEKARLRGLG